MSYASTVISLHPKHYYRMGELTGTTMVDEMGAVNLTYSGSAVLGESSLTTDSSTNTSMRLTGTGTQNILFYPQSTIGPTYTISFIIQTTSVNNEIIYMFYGGTTNILTINGSGNIQLNSQYHGIITGPVVSDGSPHHIILINDQSIGGYYLLYVDGALIGNIGTYSTYGLDLFRTFVGTVDELALFENSKLTTYQIQRLYQSSIGSQVSLGNYYDFNLFLGPYRYYNFAETTGTLAGDVTGYTTGATITGSGYNLATAGLLSEGGSALDLGALPLIEKYISPAITLSNAFTLSFLLKPTYLTGTISLWYTTGGQTLELINGQIYFNGTCINTDITLGLNNTYHISIVRDSVSNIRAYINGRHKYGVANYTAGISGLDLFRDILGNNLQGIVDELTIFLFGFSKIQAQESYMLSVGLDITPFSYNDLVNYLLPSHYWRFGDLTGSTILDEVLTKNLTYGIGSILGQASLIQSDSVNHAAALTGVPGQEISLVGTQTIVGEFTFIINIQTNVFFCNIVKTNTFDIHITSTGHLRLHVIATNLFLESTNVVTDNTPKNIIVTYNSVGFIKLYINGIQQGLSETMGNTTNFESLFSETQLQTNLFAGIVDECVIIDYEITIETLNELVNFSSNILPYPARVLAYNPVGYWRLADEIGTICTNEIAGGVEGTYANTPTLLALSLITNDDNRAVDFTPINSRITFPFITGLTDVTTSIAFKATNVGVRNNILSTGSYELYIGPTGLLTIFAIAEQVTGYNIYANDIYLLHITQSVGVIKIWVNGQLEFTGTYDQAVPLSLINVGSFTTGENFSGVLDEVSFYNKILEDVVIEGLYRKFNGEILNYINGTIQEDVTAYLWYIRTYLLDSGELTSDNFISGTTFSNIIPSLHKSKPHYITCLPYQGDVWVGETTHVLNSLVFPTNTSTFPYYYKCITAGTTEAVEPIWPSGVLANIQDGTVIWQKVEQLNQPITHSPILPN